MGETSKKESFLVEGDHPVFRRVYDRFYNETEALDLTEEMKTFNYENITINGKEIDTHDEK